MDNLPEELWVYEILPYLDLYELCIIRRVSSTFNTRIKNYLSTITSLDIREYYNIIDEPGFHMILKCLKNITYVNVSKCWNVINDASMELLTERCKDIEIFISNGCGDVSNDIIYMLVKKCQNIKYLSISKCFNITHSTIYYIAKYLSNLEELYVANNYGIKDESVQLIAEKCNKLVKLDLGGCNIRGYTLDGFLNESAKLKEIRLTKCLYVSESYVERLVAKGIVVNTCF